jgi:hypothetical protein
MAGSDSLTDSIRGWFERSPKAQRAVKRFAEDLDVVAGRVEKATSGLMEKVGPIIDPPARVAAPDQDAPPAAARRADVSRSASSPGAAPDAPPVIPESESSVPPAVKRDGEPVDPTT